MSRKLASYKELKYNLTVIDALKIYDVAFVESYNESISWEE